MICTEEGTYDFEWQLEDPPDDQLRKKPCGGCGGGKPSRLRGIIPHPKPEESKGVSGWSTERCIALIGAVFGGIAMCISAWNNTKLDTVRDKQEVQVEKNDTRDAKLDRIEKETEKTATTVQDTLGPQLWSTWKYLQSKAEDDPTPENVLKAGEAKLTYENHVKKSNGK